MSNFILFFLFLIFGILNLASLSTVSNFLFWVHLANFGVKYTPEGRGLARIWAGTPLPKSSPATPFHQVQGAPLELQCSFQEDQ